MILKKLNYIVVFLVLVLFAVNVFSAVSTTDKLAIKDQIQLVTVAVNMGNFNYIKNIISPNASDQLKTEISNAIDGKSITFKQNIVSYEYLGNNEVKVKCKFSAEGLSWNVDGLTNEYTFVKSDESWLILNTNFQNRIDGSYIFKIIGKIFVIALPFLLISFAFWLWMLIDCTKRNFNDKVMWIILLVLLNIFGALLYLFLVKLRKKKEDVI